MKTLQHGHAAGSGNASGVTTAPAAAEPDPPADHSIMSRLRYATQALHDQAEVSPFQKALIAGELPIESYVALLEQLYHVHDALERDLDALRRISPVAAAVLRDEHFQTPYLREDLLHFGREPGASEPALAVGQLITAIEHAAGRRPIALLGAQYVLEGSNNGSKFIARRLISAYSLRPGPGLRYMDPYGESQRAVWAAFKAAMNAQAFSEAEVVAMMVVARWTFVGIMSLGEELLADRLIIAR